ncbi:unnamed protein product [Dibothriocephalus latus]|uniref:XPG N-terminal domain-containing protein n=1 Tax=Dibothriocephalus latus TaxID=60516 RepID=A0A3P7NWG0_DIBLA|nr:unnamed protein product [Dibothriocephalus latus]
MGVSLLQTFLRNNPSNFTTYRLHSTTIVVDGPNIANNLYEEASILNQFNGEYLQYEALVERYLLNMRKCEVEPIFVFDGLHEVRIFSKSDAMLNVLLYGINTYYLLF